MHFRTNGDVVASEYYQVAEEHVGFLSYVCVQLLIYKSTYRHAQRTVSTLEPKVTAAADLVGSS